MESSNAVLSLEYTLLPDEYTRFILAITGRRFAQKKRRTAITAIAETGLGAVFLALGIRGSNGYVYIVLAVIMILLGIYSLLLYSLIVPAKVRRAAKKQYEQNNLINNHIKINFYEDCFVEQFVGGESRVPFADVESEEIQSGARFWHLGGKKTLMIPQRALNEEKAAVLDGIVKNIMNSRKPRK